MQLDLDSDPDNCLFFHLPKVSALSCANISLHYLLCSSVLGWRSFHIPVCVQSIQFYCVYKYNELTVVFVLSFKSLMKILNNTSRPCDRLSLFSLSDQFVKWKIRNNLCKFEEGGSARLVPLLWYLGPLWPVYGNAIAYNTRSVSKLKILQSTLQQPIKEIVILQEDINLT